MTTPAPEGRGPGITGILAVAAAVLLPLGLAMILLGWYGAAHTPYLFEQVPYLISGGLLGLGLAVVGALVYFGSWIARGNAEQHDHNEKVTALLTEIRDAMQTAAPAPAPRTASNGHVKPVPAGALVATAKGGMIHRPDCAVVAGRDDLRTVSADDTLAPCSLCSPLAVDVVSAS